MTRPRAADDFAAIRARMEELRREQSQISRDDAGRAKTSVTARESAENLKALPKAEPGLAGIRSRR